MNETISGVFIIGVLVFYAGLIAGFLLWNVGRSLRRSGKKKTRAAVVELPSLSRVFNPTQDAH